MADICFDITSEGESNSACEQSTRRRMELRRFKFVPDLASQSEDETATGIDRQRPMINLIPSEKARLEEDGEMLVPSEPFVPDPGPINPVSDTNDFPRYGQTLVCGRRREMEDTVAVHPNLSRRGLHFFGVYDGHGCSHVSTRCSERLHELVREEMEIERAEEEESAVAIEWRPAMERSFHRMDKEVTALKMESAAGAGPKCRCELRSPACDAVGSTAVVAVVTPDKIVVANCGDSRAVLCRAGKAVPLSSDHKPERPDELNRIQEAGGRVIYWDGPRVLGVLAMSRAIGDNYLKPYVICEPEVAVMDRTADDECLILGTDGLWDVVSNETACGVACTCLRGGAPSSVKAAAGPSPSGTGECGGGRGRGADKACSDAAVLLTKLALARHSTDNVSVVVVDLRKRAT